MKISIKNRYDIKYKNIAYWCHVISKFFINKFKFVKTSSAIGGNSYE